MSLPDFTPLLSSPSSSTSFLLLSSLTEPKLISLLKALSSFSPPSSIPPPSSFLPLIKELTFGLGLPFIFLLLRDLPTLLAIFGRFDITSQKNIAIYHQLLSIIIERTSKLKNLGPDISDIANLPFIETQLIHLNSSSLSIPPSSSLLPPPSSFDSLYLSSLLLTNKIQLLLSSLNSFGKREKEQFSLMKSELNTLQTKILLFLSESMPTPLQLPALKQELGKIRESMVFLEEKENFSDMMEKKRKNARKIEKFTSFQKNQSLPLENAENEYKNYYFPMGKDQLEKLQILIVAFLNTNGGRIYLGVKDYEFLVCGMYLKEKDKSKLKNDFETIFNNLVPSLPSSRWKMYFLPIYGGGGDGFRIIQNHYVVKIVVKRGRKDTLYFTSFNEAHERRDGKNHLLSPPEFKEEIKRRSKEQVSEDDWNNSEFTDPEPEESNKNLQKQGFSNYSNKEKRQSPIFVDKPYKLKLESEEYPKLGEKNIDKEKNSIDKQEQSFDPYPKILTQLEKPGETPEKPGKKAENSVKQSEKSAKLPGKSGDIYENPVVMSEKSINAAQKSQFSIENEKKSKIIKVEADEDTDFFELVDSIRRKIEDFQIEIEKIVSQSTKRICFFQVKYQIGESLVERLEKGWEGKAGVKIAKEKEYEKFAKWFLMKIRKI